MSGKVAVILVLSTLLLAATLVGCGNVPTAALGDDSVPAVLTRGDDSSTHGCDIYRSLQLQLIFDGAELQRDLEILGLIRHDVVPPFEAAFVGVDSAHHDALVSRIVELVSQAYAPFGIDVVAVMDDAVAFANDALAPQSGPVDDAVGSAVPAEVVSRVIVTQVEGAPKMCRCQGATGELGLTDDGSAEGIVLANAFRDNGLAAALQRWPKDERVEMAAAAIANSIVHEAGHTFGLVHLDVPGAPTLFMARGGAAATLLSVEEMTTFQSFSSNSLPVTGDAVSVRTTQCDSCVLSEVIESRRTCGSARSTR